MSEQAVAEEEEEAAELAGPRLYPDRPDAQPADQEREVGQSANLEGLAVTVTGAEFRQELSEFEQDGYLVS